MEDTEYLNKIVGLIINDVYTETETIISLKEKKEEETNETISVYIQLHFNKYTLNIYNKFEIIPNRKTSDLKGLKVISIEETKEEVNLLLDNGTCIKINLRDEAYMGPEAMCLYGPDNLCVVWN